MQEFYFKMNDDARSYAVVKYIGNEPDVIIPASYCGAPITVLADRLFMYHKEIRTVKIPDTVTDMGEFLFEDCDDLRHIELPSQLLYLWGYTFVRCGIEEITLPDKLAALPPFAFKECRRLKKVVCGAGMKKVYAWVFGGCDNLTEFIHSDAVEVSPQAFESKILNT